MFIIFLHFNTLHNKIKNINTKDEEQNDKTKLEAKYCKHKTKNDHEKKDK